MSHEFEQGIGNRTGAWHGLMDIWTPEYEDDVLDWLTALQLSGLGGWDVYKDPIIRKGTPTGKFWVVRGKDDTILGHNVSDQYQIIQNEQGFKYLDQLVEAGELEIETAMSLYQGRVVTILARKPNGVKVGDDDFDNFIGFTNRHDGLGACKVFTTRVRIVCANTQSLSEGEFRKSGRHWSIRHQGDTELKLSEAREALQLSFEEDEQFANAMNQLLSQPLEQTTYSKNVKAIVGIYDIDRSKHPKKYKNAMNLAFRIDEIRRTTDNLQNVSETDYGLFQAITQLESHEKRYSNDATKFQNLAVEGGELTNRAFSLLMA